MSTPTMRYAERTHADILRELEECLTRIDDLAQRFKAIGGRIDPDRTRPDVPTIREFDAIANLTEQLIGRLEDHWPGREQAETVRP